MASAGKSLLDVGKKFMSRRARQKAGEIKQISVHKTPIRLVQPHLPVEKTKLTKAMKDEIHKEFNQMKLELKPVPPDQLLHELDVSIEGFFSKRDFTIENFNTLLQILGQKGRIDDALGVVEKMKILGVVPNLNSYVFLISASGRAGDTQTAELIFNKAKRELDEAPAALYTALISSYVHKADHDSILRLINEKSDLGFENSTVDYTCYMNSLIRAGKPQDAIEVYRSKLPYLDVDEYLFAMVLHACSKTNEAEYALRIWDQLKSFGFAPVAYFYNEIIMSLAKRKDYAEKALEIYKQMRMEMVAPDTRTFNGVLTACSRLGDLPVARTALSEMKIYNIELDQTKSSLLLSIYAGACAEANEDAKDLFIKESWELFRLCEKSGWVNAMIINSLLSVHTSAFLDKQVEGMILPLYDQYGVKKDMHCYRHLIRMYNELAEYKRINAVWDAMKAEGVKPDMYILNGYLKATMKNRDTDRGVEALEKFKELGYKPLYMYLKLLHQAEDLPLRIWSALQEFDYIYSRENNNNYSKRLRIDRIEQRFTK